MSKLSKLALMKCEDCGAIRHRIVPLDSIIRCGACGSENVTYPYNPTYQESRQEVRR